MEDNQADGGLVTVEGLRDYLGAGEENDGLIAPLRDAAIGQLNRATGTDWTYETDLALASEAIRVMVWLSYYGVRDEAKNTAFLEEYLSGIITHLQLRGGDAMIRDKKIQFYQKQPQTDPGGNPLLDADGFPLELWQPVTGLLWASVKDQSGREFYAADATQREAISSFNISYREDVTTDMRVLFDEKYYGVVRIYHGTYRKFGLYVDGKRIEGAGD